MKVKNKIERRQGIAFIKLAGPSLLVFAIIFLVPFIYSLSISFADGESVLSGVLELNGLNNYVAVFTSKDFYASLLHTLIFVLSTIVIELAIALLTAVLLNEELPGAKFFRLIFSIPLMIAPVVAGLMWRWMFADQYGVINSLLGIVGLEGPLWFASPLAAFSAILISNVWLATPFVILVLLSGMANLSAELNEAAEIDGASKWQIFWKVVLPQLKPALLIILVIRITDAARVYDLVYILTGGGPGGSTEVVSTYIYKQIFVFLRFGEGAAASIVITILILGVSNLLNKLLSSEEI